MVLHDGLEGDVLLPGLYPGSHEHADDAVKLGRATEWVGAEGEVVRGAGGKLFLAGDNPVEFVKWHDLVLERPN